ncbi:MAG: TetR/AcrR family transcriptional regulator [Candidatus Brocadiia bacterium]
MGDKAHKILQTAEKLFAEGRFHEVTLDHICHEAGVGKGTIYRYFDDKEDLYFQVILTGLDELVESMRQVREEVDDPREGLRRACCRVVEFYRKRKALFRLMHSEQIRGSDRKGQMWRTWRERHHEMLDVFADFVRMAMAAGVYTATPKPEAVARLIGGMLRSGVRHEDEMPGGKDWPAAIVELLENGLLPRDNGETN